MRDDELVPPPGRVLVMQIITGALLAGLLAMAGIMLFLVHTANPPRQPPDLPLLALLALGMLAIEFPIALLLPRAQTAGALRLIAAGTWRPPEGMDPEQFRTLADKLLAVRQTALILRLALFEGVGFFACIAYFLEAHPLALAIAGVAFLAMVLNFPTTEGLRTWLRRQQDALLEMESTDRL